MDFPTGSTQGSAAFEERRCSLAFKGAENVSIFGQTIKRYDILCAFLCTYVCYIS